MTLAEAVEAFERDFRVSDVVGWAAPGEALDHDYAPDGSRYVVLTSGGQRRDPGGSAAWFTGEERAADEWLRQAWRYAEQRGGGDLYWRDRPVFRGVEFMAFNQAAVMQDVITRQSINISVGFVYSRLLVTKGDGETGKAGK